jgi:hypothetical protein
MWWHKVDEEVTLLFSRHEAERDLINQSGKNPQQMEAQLSRQVKPLTRFLWMNL